MASSPASRGPRTSCAIPIFRCGSRTSRWVSPTAVALLTAVAANEIFEVRTVSVDGSAPGVESLSTTVAEPVTGLVGSPDPGLATYSVTPTNLIDLSDRAPYGFVGGPATSFGYVG